MVFIVIIPALAKNFRNSQRYIAHHKTNIYHKYLPAKQKDLLLDQTKNNQKYYLLIANIDFFIYVAA